jgi:hypothetical protein
MPSIFGTDRSRPCIDNSNPAFYMTGEAAVLRENSDCLGRTSAILTRPQFFSTPENFHFVLKAFDQLEKQETA